MCSRYNLTLPPEAVRAYFRLPAIADFPPRYNIAPSQPAGIVRTSARGGPEFVLVRWGLIPSWVKDPRQFAMLINARGESAAEKPSFRGAMRHRRCLVPATGFYEWTGAPRHRMPHLIRPRDRGVLALAGLWEHWLGADGSEIETMAIITVAANPTVAPLHDRMPAIIAPADFDAWLDCRSGSAVGPATLLQPCSADLLEVVPVDPRINNPRNEGADLLGAAAG